MSLWQYWATTVLMGVAVIGCKPASSGSGSAKVPPAKVASPPQESKLNNIELTEAAEQRLGIQVAPVEFRKVPTTRTFAGEVVLPLGASVVVSAPVNGTLRVPNGGKVPKVGESVKRKQPIFGLVPLLSPDARLALVTAQADADGQVKRAQTRLEAAQKTLELAQQARQEKVGTLQAVNDAKERVSDAQEALDAAKAVKALRDGNANDEASAAADLLVIEAPQAGVVRAVTAVAGQIVPAGAPLFDVMDYSTVWIRVPVYVGELAEVSPSQPAQVSSLSDKPGAKTASAKPVAAPPSATPLSSTADLYYELANADGKLRPGEKVSATLILQGDQESLVVPWSAVVHDIHGGNWVYEKTAPQTYVRRRVEVRSVVQPYAVLSSGLAAGKEVAVEGVAELYGTEFGFGGK